MELTEEQIAEAGRVLREREKERARRASEEHARKMREADERFEEKMDREYPGTDRDIRYAIYSDYAEWYR